MALIEIDALPNLKMGGSFHGELLVITRWYILLLAHQLASHIRDLSEKIWGWSPFSAEKTCHMSGVQWRPHRLAHFALPPGIISGRIRTYHIHSTYLHLYLYILHLYIYIYRDIYIYTNIRPTMNHIIVCVYHISMYIYIYTMDYHGIHNMSWAKSTASSFRVRLVRLSATSWRFVKPRHGGIHLGFWMWKKWGDCDINPAMYDPFMIHLWSIYDVF